MFDFSTSNFENFCRHEMRVGQGYNIANYRFALAGLHKKLFTKNGQAVGLMNRLLYYSTRVHCTRTMYIRYTVSRD